MSEKIKIEDGIISFFGQGTIFIEIWSSELDLMTKQQRSHTPFSTYQCGEDIVIILCHHPHGESLRKKVTNRERHWETGKFINDQRD